MVAQDRRPQLIPENTGAENLLNKLILNSNTIGKSVIFAALLIYNEE